ncbi:MAG TPA: hypothetical protein VFU43_05640 [Streptosporangiaceae bacterium]|nr:hypothetical protein [Streptosporangiaceae bacterium]
MWRAGYGQVVAISFVCCLIVGSLTLQWARSGQRPRCAPLTAASVIRDDAWTERFAAYGDGNARLDDWTGADGTWSVRLPDGRTVWIFADTFLGPVRPGPNLRGRPHAWRTAATAPLIHNSAVVESADGMLTTTLRGSAANGAPAAWIGAGDVYWPMSAVLDGGALRVFLQRIGASDDRHPFGVVRRAAVATVPLSRLSRPGPITPLPKPPRDSAGEQVFYGIGALRAGRYVYIYGATSNTTRGGQSAYLARVPAGRVTHLDDWEYWRGTGAGTRTAPGTGAGTAAAATGGGGGGSEWGGPAGARPVLPFVPRRTGVSAGFSVVRRNGTYVLFTMDPTRPVGGISRIASYWSCDPAGPWHGPAPVYDPPEVVRGGTTFAYSPFAHPEQGGPGLLLSYNLNDTRRAHENVGLYRPKFIRVSLR